ncbi:hypothetical protein So717_25580 [Roseobacter cerasinus]|uniref:FecR protein domain-containing protein n=1 Tax=Roseobacter cerasinus TaxID=2602289 RepID=A0A640VV81_9RHOB|nr:FecR family protein [Roseobacter cerasinus]GFE50805.1 hypothetical protein So717_25580 [Roseobacter cerasinus]
MRLFPKIILALIVLAPAVSAQSQRPANCEIATVQDPERQVLSCAFGVTIELDAAAQMGFLGVTDGGAPDVIELDSGAVLLEVAPGEARPQIRTPHAIAAVRGTIYVVEVEGDKTSVFVIEGEVAVTQRDANGADVILRAGDGVDVRDGAALEARPWPAERAAGLLARFGR